MKRQNLRKLLSILSLLLFPVTLYYFSPALIINAGLEGIINGSFIVFILLLIGSIFFGRLFCAYLCPAGGLQEVLLLVNNKPPKQGWRNHIKYVLWIAWVISVILCYIGKGKILKVDFFYQTEYGISVSHIYVYIIYYGILLLILIPALIGGKRTFCHYFCWMAPFMVWGMKIRNFFHLPGFRVTIDQSHCVSCGKCSKSCPMCIDVPKSLSGRGERQTDTECIQCGECIDCCPKKVLQYSIRKEK